MAITDDDRDAMRDDARIGRDEDAQPRWDAQRRRVEEALVNVPPPVTQPNWPPREAAVNAAGVARCRAAMAARRRPDRRNPGGRS